jgi:hypothetical protein
MTKLSDLRRMAKDADGNSDVVSVALKILANEHPDYVVVARDLSHEDTKFAVNLCRDITRADTPWPQYIEALHKSIIAAAERDGD